MLKNRINTKNVKKEYKKLIMPFIEKISKKEDVIAVMLLGGLSDNNNRDFADEYSDIDVSVVYDNKDRIYYAPNYEFYVFFKNKPIEVNVHQMLYSDEQKMEWDEGKKEAYSKVEYVYEKNNLFRNLVNSKIRMHDEERKNKLAMLLRQYMWFVEINPIRAIKRGLYSNGIDLLNRGIELYIESLYLINNQYVPHCKWRIDQARDLKIVPKNFINDLNNALITKSVDKKGILEKRDNVIKLFAMLKDIVKDEFDMSVEELYSYACKNSYSDRQLLETTYSDDLIHRHANNMSIKQRRLLESFINNNVIGSDDEFVSYDKNEIDQIYIEIFKEVKRKVLNDKEN